MMHTACVCIYICIYTHINWTWKQATSYLRVIRGYSGQDLKLDASLTYFAQPRRREKLTLRNYSNIAPGRERRSLVVDAANSLFDEIIENN